MCAMCIFNYQIRFLRSWNVWFSRPIVLEKGGAYCSGASEVLSRLHVKCRMASCKFGKIWWCATHCILFAEGKTDGYPSQMCKQKRCSRKLSAFPYGERRAREGECLMRWSNKFFAVCWWNAWVLAVWSRRVKELFTGSEVLLWLLFLPETNYLAEVGPFGSTCVVCCTDLPKLGRRNEVGDNLALLMSWMPVVRHFLNHLNGSPPSSWTQQMCVGLPAWASVGTLTSAWQTSGMDGIMWCPKLILGQLGAFLWNLGPVKLIVLLK